MRLHPGREDSDLPNAVDRSIDLRFSALDAARQPLVTVMVDEPLQAARARMTLNDYSQLPVLDASDVVHGVVSWKSIGSRCRPDGPSIVRDYLELPNFVNYSDFLLPWVNFIAEHDFVLVRDGADPLCGIVTAADLSLEFGHFARPYLLLNEIELRLRDMLGAVITVDEMVVRLNGRSIKRNFCSVGDLTLYQLQSLMDDADVWARLSLDISRPEFIAALDNVRKMRNAIAHVDSKSPTEHQIIELEKFAKALRSLARTIRGGTVRAVLVA
jgi:restriction system protein